MFFTDMALPHFFLETQILEHELEPMFSLRLSKDDLAHARVLRLKPPEHIAVIDATGVYYECKIVQFDAAGLFVRISRKAADANSQRPWLTLALGLSKANKMDMVMRSATELGVNAFIPFSCERSVVKLDERKNETRLSRWRAILKSAAMQSGQVRIPELDTPKTFDELCLCAEHAHLVLICWEEEEEAQLGDVLVRALLTQGIRLEDARILLIIGPEGGLSFSEIALIQASNPFAFTVSLGPSILRTETAGIIAPALTLYELDRMKRTELQEQIFKPIVCQNAI